MSTTTSKKGSTTTMSYTIPISSTGQRINGTEQVPICMLKGYTMGFMVNNYLSPWA